MANDFTMADYATLAQLAKPQMIGNAPVGAGYGAGMQYREDKNRYDNFLAEAGRSAELKALLQAQAAGEHMRGAPGRSAEIDVKNSLSQGKLNSLPDLLEAQSGQAKEAAEAPKEAARKRELAKLERYSEEWNQAKDVDSKKSLMDRMQADGLTKIGTRNLAEVPVEKMDQLMSGLYQSRRNSIGHQQKMDVEAAKQLREETKGNYSLNREEIKGDYSLARQELANAGRAKAAELAAQAKTADGSTTLQKQLGELLKKIKDGTASPLEYATWSHYWATQLERDRARAANAGPQMRSDIAPEVFKSPEQPQVIAPPRPDTIPNPGVGAATPKSKAVPGAISKDQAIAKLKAAKGTPQYETMVKFYKETYGEEPPK